MMWSKPILPMLLVTVVLVGPVGRAFAAEPTDWGENDIGIDEAVSRGIALRRSGNDEAALAVFLEVEKRDPNSVRLLLHISTAAVAVGKWVMAYDYLQKATNHREDPYYQRHLAAIENVARTIGERVGQFRARGVPAGAEVRLNGELVGTLPMNQGTPLEVGSYMLEVSRPGYFPLRRPITIAGQGTAQEDVELRTLDTVAISSGTQSADSQATAPSGDTGKPQTGLRARWVTWTLAGVAAAAAVTSGVSFAIREQKANEWNNSSICLSQAFPQMTRGEVCPNTRHAIDLAQGVGIGAGVAAVAFGGAALVHWALTTRVGRSSDETTSAAAPAYCSPGLASIVCSGSF
jgi:hypothetical protein